MSPLFFAILQRWGRKALWVFPVLFLLDGGCVGTSLMIGVSRFPVYFLGMYLGREAAEGKTPSRRHLALAGGLLVVSMVAYYFLVVYFPGSLKRYGFWWHPFLLSTPGCLYGTTWLMEKQERWKVTRAVNRGLGFLGGKSFEIYLIHIFIYSLGLYFGAQGWKQWILLALAGLRVGVGYGQLIDLFTGWRKARA